MSAHVLRSSFNAGEISPLMDARVDAEKYNFSCRRLENFIPKIYGGAFRRPGMVYLGQVGDSSKEVMLMPFNVSANVRYVIEMGDLYMRVWNADGTPFIDKINAPNTDVLEVITPYTSAQIFDFKFVQLNNVAFFAHPDHAPQQLTRSYDASYAAFDFAWTEAPLSYPCFRSTNQTVTTAKPAATSGITTIAFSSDIFDETLDYSKYIGAKIQITQRRNNSFVDLALTALGSSPDIDILGDFTLTTYGTWDGELTIERKDGAGVFEAIRSFSSSKDRNVEFVSTQLETGTIRLRFAAASAGTGSPRAVLEVADSRVTGVAQITSVGFVSSLPVVNVTITKTLYSADATTEWALEAWAGYAGYPRSVTFHEQRLWFGGTDLEPNTFWGSITNDFLNFRRGAYDADSLSFTLAAQEGSAIQSMLSHEALVIFTQTEEWTATTSEQTAITPSNIFVRRQSRFGSAFRQAFIANNNILFLQRGSRKLREFGYSAKEAGGESDDLSVLAEHITKGGVKQMAYQQQPDPVIWMVTTAGLLISMTYEATQNVIAWSQHPTTGTVESVAVIYGTGDASDEVWIVVNRANGRGIERIDPNAVTSLENGNLSEMIYLDSAVRRVYPQKTIIVKGLGHLDGEMVSILADNYRVPDQVVSNGEVTLEEGALCVLVGLPYTSILQPSKIDIPMDDGTGIGRKWICKRVNLNLYKTIGLEYADSPDAIDSKWYDIPSSIVDGQELFTGLVDVNNSGSHRENVNVAVRQRLPYPCNLLAMVAKCDVLGN